MTARRMQTRSPASTLPPETFRIRPSRRSRRYFIVHVASGLGAMRRMIRENTGWCHPRLLACVVSMTELRRGRRCSGLLGIVYFSRRHIGAGIVTHEMGHAAFRTLESRGQRVDHWRWREGALIAERTRTAATVPAEEAYCGVLEHLSRDFWNKAYATGIVK